MRPRKEPLIEYGEKDTRDIVFHVQSIEAETTGTINNRGYLYVGQNYAGRKATTMIWRENGNQ